MFLRNVNHNSITGSALKPPLKLKWQYKTKGSIYSSPSVVDGQLFVGSHDNNLYALNVKNGKLIWKFATGGQITSSPAVFDSVVYVGSKDGYIYAINAKGGNLFWKYKTW